MLTFAFGLLFFCGLLLLLFPAPRFSESENRLLAERPTLTWEALCDGSYTEGFSTYASERMRGRRMMRGVRAVADLALGKREVSDVMLCRDGTLTKRTRTSERSYEKNRRAIANLKKRAEALDLPLTVAVVPSRIDARTDILPRLYRADTRAPLYDTLQKSLPYAIAFTDVTKDEEWFRTDHHWTQEGAFAAYQALGSYLGYEPYGREDFSVETASELFWGTTDAAAGIPFVRPDKLELWRYGGDTDLRLTKDGRSADFEGLYDFSRLEVRDKYGVFLGGNDGVLTIDQGENDNRETLLVIKDSFANALLPFLARHFRIVAVDPRYTPSGAEAILEGADKALVLFGMQTLSETSLF